MDRKAAVTVLVGTLVAVVLVAVATAGDVEYVEGPPSFARDPDEGPGPTLPAATTIDLPPSDREPLRIPSFVETFVNVVLVVALVVGAILAVVYAWRHRPRLRWRWRGRDDFDVPVDLAAAVAADAAAQHAALRTGAPRNAIVACWLRLEQSVTDAGVRRSPSDTSTELVERVLRSHDVDGDAITMLAALYREARFSTHDMDEQARASAIEALETVHRSLRHSSHDGFDGDTSNPVPDPGRAASR